jgi:hypothetical protein
MRTALPAALRSARGSGGHRAVGVREERLPRLSCEAFLGGGPTQEPVQSGIGASDDPRSLQVPLAATNEQEVDRLFERVPSGECKLEHRFGPRQRIGAERLDIKAPTHC